MTVVSSLHVGQLSGVCSASLESAFATDGGLLVDVRLYLFSSVELVFGHLLCRRG